MITFTLIALLVLLLIAVIRVNRKIAREREFLARLESMREGEDFRARNDAMWGMRNSQRAR